MANSAARFSAGASSACECTLLIPTDDPRVAGFPNKGGVGRIGSHHDALAALQNFRKHFLRARADQPMAFLGDADGYSFVLVGVETTNDGCCGGEGDFVFAGAAAEEDSYAKPFFFV